MSQVKSLCDPQLSQEDHESRMGHSSAQTYPQRSVSRERLCFGFSVQRTLNRRPRPQRLKVLSMALCWLLGDPGRRAPKGLQYPVLLWQEGLPCQHLSKESHWSWYPVLDFGAEAGVSWNMPSKSHSTTTCTRCAHFWLKSDPVHRDLMHRDTACSWLT